MFILTSPVLEHNERKEERSTTLNIGWVGDFGNGNNISKDFSHKKSVFTILFPQIKELTMPITLTLIGIKNKNDIPEIVDYFKDNSNIKVNIPTNLNWEKTNGIYSEIKSLT